MERQVFEVKRQAITAVLKAGSLEYRLAEALDERMFELSGVIEDTPHDAPEKQKLRAVYSILRDIRETCRIARVISDESLIALALVGCADTGCDIAGPDDQ